MSVIKNELQKLANRAGGAFKTVSDRESMAGRIADALKAANIQISSIEHLKSKHIESYIQGRLQDGIGKRTLQNEMSSMRGILREAGRDTLADSERISNKSLGIDNASRNGTHLAMPNDMYNSLVERLELTDKDVCACAQIERYLGLRGEEAVQADKSLATWEKQLAKGDVIRVIYGTKGGRPRDTRVVDIEKAREAVRNAQERTKVNGGRIIDKPDLQSAMDRHSYIMRTHGCKGEHSPHALRYAFACDRVEAYKSQGFSLKESLAMTSMDLGHGDGRGRYIAQVYLRK
jgi:site-specific recombinase XerC